MKLKFYYAFLIATCFLAILYACQKEQPGDQREKKATIKGARMTVPEARKYYNKLKAGQGNEVNMKALKVSSKQPNRKYILFEKAYTSESDVATFVEVPVLYNQRFGSVVNKTDENGKPNLKEGTEIFEASFDRLLLYRNKNTGQTDQRIITYIPGINYLRRHKGDISHNQINKLDKDFEGFIEYKKWDGTKLYLLEIKDGKTVNRTSLLNNVARDTGRVGINTVTCYTTIIEQWGQSCVSADPEGWIEVCTPYIIGTITYENCYDDGMTGDPCIDYGDCGTGNPCIDYGYCPENPSPEPDPCTGCQTPDPVTPVANHQLSNTSRLPPRQTSDTQVGATCVFKTMEWISKYFGGSKTVGTFILEYGLSKGMNMDEIIAMINRDGVPASELNSLVGSHFNITGTSNLQTSIDNGHPVMATIVAGSGGHEVMVTGYYNDGKIEYFDPETGTYGAKHANEFSHLIEIKSAK